MVKKNLKNFGIFNQIIGENPFSKILRCR